MCVECKTGVCLSAAGSTCYRLNTRRQCFIFFYMRFGAELIAYLCLALAFVGSGMTGRQPRVSNAKPSCLCWVGDARPATPFVECKPACISAYTGSTHTAVVRYSFYCFFVWCCARCVPVSMAIYYYGASDMVIYLRTTRYLVCGMSAKVLRSRL